MIDLDNLTHEEKELLSEDCEDFLLHRNIPLRSHSYDNIIMHAIREGYQIGKFDRRGHWNNRPPELPKMD